MSGWELPDTSILAGHLRRLDLDGAQPSLQVESREPLISGTHPKELVTCRLPGGRRITLFCKYGVSERHHRAHGHRAGVRLESTVYDRILEPLGIPCARRFRPVGNGSDGRPWLVLEYLEGSQFVSRCADRTPCEEAARIAGRLHAGTEGALPPVVRDELITYDEAYYRGWAHRAVRFLESESHRNRDVAWLSLLEARADEWIDPLVSAPQGLVHGEFYPGNLLAWRGRVVPVDWESAAMGAGEIDLAALTEGWGEEDSRGLERAYSDARWPGGAPTNHPRTLAAARIYLDLRWLGDRRDWSLPELSKGRVTRLRSLATGLGLL